MPSVVAKLDARCDRCQAVGGLRLLSDDGIWCAWCGYAYENIRHVDALAHAVAENLGVVSPGSEKVQNNT